jgi:glutamate carboxypeptidase
MTTSGNSHWTAIDESMPRMKQLLRNLCDVNSGSTNVRGISRVLDMVADEFARLGASVQRTTLEPVPKPDEPGATLLAGELLNARLRPGAKHRVLLVIHTDTVYPLDHTFQRLVDINSDTWNGPGVADAKGGIIVLILTLIGLHRAVEAGEVDPDSIGWEVVLNPDEEIGSPASKGFLIDAGKRNDLAMVFEPSLADGSIVGERKGTGNFYVTVHGKSAHAGRDFHAGRSAIVALADLVRRMDELNRIEESITVNCGKIAGGIAPNVVADLASAVFNVRVATPEQLAKISQLIDDAMSHTRRMSGISVRVDGGFHAPPMPMDDRRKRLYEAWLQCAAELGVKSAVGTSGGASDGNKLHAVGVPVLDGIGPVGGKLHSTDEFLLVPSLAERAKVNASFLAKIAGGQVP